MNKKHYQSTEYKYPVASRKQLLEIFTIAKKPLALTQIADKLQYSGNQIEGLSRRLLAMVRDGQLLYNRNQDFCVLAKMDLIIGTIQGHSEGFGFLIPEDSLENNGKDLFVHFRQMVKVMHGDKVLAHKVEFKGKLEAKIIEVLEPGNKTLVARFISEAGIGIAIPVNTRIKHEIIIPENQQKNARPNEMVLVEITKQPSKRFQAVGKIIEVLGGHLDPGMEIDVALHAWGIPHTWSDEVLAYASQIPVQVKLDDFTNRVDLINTPLITIDGEDSRDFDDAVWCEPNSSNSQNNSKSGWRVLVAIADVAQYVAKDSVLDIEAKQRATSVYFPEFVVPMLPETLSNGICSLNPQQNRCALVCEMNINLQGVVDDYKFYEAIINSHARLTYNQVADALDNSDNTLNKQLPVLADLHNLYLVLAKSRRQRGALDFDTVETKIQFDSNKKISKIVPVYRNDAHKIIEELMIAANVCAGDFIKNNQVPALYRVHETPKPEKVTDLREFLKEFSLQLAGGNNPQPQDYAQVLSVAKQKPEFELIQMVILRSLNQAVYSPENNGHFGLAHNIYAHFTSPIRRYPDLLVHRAIKHILTNDHNKCYYQHEVMINFGKECSLAERRADDATRDVMDWLKCEYMQDKVGQIFNGKIATVTGFGLFVRLNEIYVDGLLHISSLPQDYYHFNAIRHRLEGGSKNYAIGDELKVLVAKVNLDERKIDFVLPDSNTTTKKLTKKSTKKLGKKSAKKSAEKLAKKPNKK